MTFKETTGHLIKAGLVKTCPVNVQAITKLIRRAYLDLRMAKRGGRWPGVRRGPNEKPHCEWGFV